MQERIWWEASFKWLVNVVLFNIHDMFEFVIRKDALDKAKSHLWQQLTFMHKDWIQKFRMSQSTLAYLCTVIYREERYWNEEGGSDWYAYSHDIMVFRHNVVSYLEDKIRTGARLAHATLLTPRLQTIHLASMELSHILKNSWEQEVIHCPS